MSYKLGIHRFSVLLADHRNLKKSCLTISNLAFFFVLVSELAPNIATVTKLRDLLNRTC